MIYTYDKQSYNISCTVSVFPGQLWLPVSATLTTHTIDETTKTVTLNCNADIVNLPPGLTSIHDVRFYRQVYGNNMPEDLMAHYSPYNRFWKQDLNTFVSLTE